MSQPHNHQNENRVGEFANAPEPPKGAEVISITEKAEQALRTHGEAALFDTKLSDEAIDNYIKAKLQGLESKPSGGDLLQTAFEASVVGAKARKKRLLALETLKAAGEDWVKQNLLGSNDQIDPETKELRRELFFLLDDYEEQRADLARAVAAALQSANGAQMQEVGLTLSAMLYVWKERRNAE
ncbi:MAG: hypothetical protein ACREGJ_01055 [Candidatus Saccharimonadales bacterium]